MEDGAELRRLGDASLFRGDFVKAVHLYERAAKVGNAEAMFELGWLYARGRGVAVNCDKSFEWYQRAAENGYVAALVPLGMSLKCQGDNTRHAISWFKSAADQGGINSMLEIALCFREGGDGLQQDLFEAAQWYQRAANAGSEDAINFLPKLHPHLVKLAEAATQVSTIKSRTAEICIALQNFRLPALVTLKIIDAALPNNVRMFAKWRIITTFKHFHDK